MWEGLGLFTRQGLYCLWDNRVEVHHNDCVEEVGDGRNVARPLKGTKIKYWENNDQN